MTSRVDIAVCLLAGIAIGLVISGRTCNPKPVPPPAIDSLAIYADRADQRAMALAQQVAALVAERDSIRAHRPAPDTVVRVIREQVSTESITALIASVGVEAPVTVSPDSTIEGITTEHVRAMVTEYRLCQDHVAILIEDAAATARIEAALHAEVDALHEVVQWRNQQLDTLAARYADVDAARQECEARDQRRRPWAAVGKVATAIGGAAVAAWAYARAAGAGR